MFVFGGVDKRQARFSDLLEFNFDTRSWNTVRGFAAVQFRYQKLEHGERVCCSSISIRGAGIR